MKSYLKVLGLSSLAIMVPLTFITWLVDPFGIFHKPWVRENYYYKDPRIQDAGIINTADFRSIILGTSMADNFSPSEATKLFGSRFVNLSMDGASFAERSIVLNYALEERQIDNVIISLDWPGLGKSSIKATPIEPYTYLYDRSRVNDLEIYLSSASRLRLIFCRSMLMKGDSLCKGKTTDLEHLAEWYSDWDNSRRFGGLDKWLEARNSSQIVAALEEISSSIKSIRSGTIQAVSDTALLAATREHVENFNKFVLNYAAKNPNTNFYLFFPPYSRLRYAILAQSHPQTFAEYIEDLRFITQECARYPNIKLFGFETEDFPDDIANYKDTIHYHQRFNSMILGWMVRREHELRPSNIEAYISTVTKRAKAYPLMKIGKTIDDYLAARQDIGVKGSTR